MAKTTTAYRNGWIVGAKVVVPMSGMCELTAIREEEILGERYQVVEMVQPEEKSVLKVPAAQMESRGVRPPLSRKEMECLMAEELEPVDPPKEPPHRRLQRWSQLLRTGGASAPRKVLWELHRLGRPTRKEREFGDRIRLAFKSEIEHVLGVGPVDADHLINRVLGE